MGLMDKIEQAGVTGCGGAGFPTHMKLKPNMDYFIINGLECEPLLRTDRYLMKHNAGEIISAVEAVAKELSPGEVVIGIKATYKEEIQCLQDVIHALGSKIRIFQMGNFYPAGDEQILVHQVTGRTVPPGGFPHQIGVMVSNVGTMYQVAMAIRDKPFISKYVTISGEVKEPTIVKTPIGTSLMECVEMAMPLVDSYFVLEGGPMMGTIVGDERETEGVVTKTTSGIIIIKKDSYLGKRAKASINNMIHVAKSVCMSCSACTAMCPRYIIGHPLKPHKIMRLVSAITDVDDLLQNKGARQALLCSGCGVCEVYACPMGISPRRINQYLKENLGSRGIKYDGDPMPGCNNEGIVSGKVPSKRIAARAGVFKYYDYNIDKLTHVDPEEVNVPLKQHVGVSAEPVVSVGEVVKAGQVIGEIPKGKLGALIHAPISGIVKEVTQAVKIEKEKKW